MSAFVDALGTRVLRTRALVRSPIWLFRHRLGWVLGRRVLMLEHVGRRSGQPRFVCLEVVERPSADQVTVVSGFGERAQWYRNLQADPSCIVSSGFTNRMPAQTRLMTSDASAETLQRYQQAHPRAWLRLRGVIEHATGAPVGVLPMVALKLEG